jgi:hypothetical protein
MDNTELHNLDLGAPRFLELQVTLVLRQLFDTELLKSTALALVATWPVLSKRINLAVNTHQATSIRDSLS